MEKNKLTPRKIKRIITLKNKNISNREIAQKLKVSEATIRYHLQKNQRKKSFFKKIFNKLLNVGIKYMENTEKQVWKGK